jgi:hypothetical protein
MWIQSVLGAYSVVKKGSAGEWQIRARCRDDLVNLVAAAKLDGQEIIESTVTDYRYRILVDAEKLHKVMCALESSVVYKNFKERVGQIKGMEKHCAAYHSIWSILAHALQPTRPYSGARLIDDPERSVDVASSAEPTAPEVVRGKRGNGRRRRALGAEREEQV